MGSILEALIAGYIPDITPIKTEKAIPTSTPSTGMANLDLRAIVKAFTRKDEKKIPIKAPIRARTMDSARKRMKISLSICMANISAK